LRRAEAAPHASEGTHAASESRLCNVDLETHLVHVGGRTSDELLTDLLAAGIRLNKHAKTLLGSGKFQTEPNSRRMAVVVLSVHDLGLPNGADIQAIYKRALERQLALCPIELAPHFRLQYRDQPEGSIGHPSSQGVAPPGSITVACEPIDSDDSFPKGFYLRRIDGELWLRGYCSDGGHPWDSSDRFAFCRKLGSLVPGSS
jgi:hypothetical protein